MTASEAVHYREAGSADVEEMARCRLADPEAGIADPRMAAYFEGRHHPHEALAPRTGYVAVADGDVVGYIAGHRSRRFGCDGEVQYLFVAPHHRKQGVATVLLRLQAEWFKAQGATKVCVNVNLDSPTVRPFYAGRGAAALNEHWYVWPDIGALVGAGPSGSPAPGA